MAGRRKTGLLFYIIWFICIMKRSYYYSFQILIAKEIKEIRFNNEETTTLITHYLD